MTSSAISNEEIERIRDKHHTNDHTGRAESRVWRHADELRLSRFEIFIRQRSHGNYVFQNGNDRWCPCQSCTVKRNAEYRKQQADKPEEAETMKLNLPKPRQKHKSANGKSGKQEQMLGGTSNGADATARKWKNADQ